MKKPRNLYYFIIFKLNVVLHVLNSYLALHYSYTGKDRLICIKNIDSIFPTSNTSCNFGDFCSIILCHSKDVTK